MISSNKSGHELHRAFTDLLVRRFRRHGFRGGVDFSSGNPGFGPFPPALAAAHAVLNGNTMQSYGNPRGTPEVRQALLPFCEGMQLRPSRGTLTEAHILPGLGITHLYACLMEALARKAKEEQPGKTPVVLMTSPTYGMFAIQPVPFGIEVETLPLRPEELWRTNPERLDRKIRDINASDDRYVAAFYRTNPHNPFGTVEGGERTRRIAEVLRRHKVLGIDDLAYEGQEYYEAAIPLAACDFDNNVSLFSLSKAFCLPGIRAGFMCGPRDIVDLTAHATMRTIQDMPRPSEAALAASYGQDFERERWVYTAENKQGYQRRYQLLTSLVRGQRLVFSNMPDARREEIKRVTELAFRDKKIAHEIFNRGIPGLEIVNPEMNAGYFAVLRLRGAEGMYYGTQRLTNSFQIAAACVDQGGVLALPMTSAMAGEEGLGQNSIRVTFGTSELAIAKGLSGIFRALATFTEKPNPLLQDRLHARKLDFGPRFY